MPVHALVEATAHEAQLEAVLDATETFLQDTRKREDKLQRSEAFRIQGTRTVIVHLVFADALAAQQHRSKDHTHTYTQTLEEACQSVEIHELDEVRP